MNIKFVYFILFICLVNFSCKRDNVSKIDVSGITEADISGSSIGGVDNTDWNKDINWTAEESGLFQTPPFAQLDTALRSDVNFLFAYPNPIQTSVTFFSKLTKGTLVEIVITDAMLSVKDRYFITVYAGDNALQLNFDPARYANKTNYRMYYGFYSHEEGMYYRGHGDLRISR